MRHTPGNRYNEDRRLPIATPNRQLGEKNGCQALRRMAENLPPAMGPAEPAQDLGQRESRFHFLRGACATVLLGALGFVVPILVVVGFTVCRWIVQGASEFDRGYDLHWLPQRLIYPAVGTAFVFAAAGWATFAARGGYRFARTFATIFAISVPCWFALAVLGISPPRYKNLDHPLIYYAEALMFAIPPLAAALVLSIRRGYRSKSRGATADQKAGPPAAS